MANNRINKYIGAITLGTVLMVVPGCTDTWDDHYSANGNGSEATLTLWEQIKNNPDYSLFSEILEQAKYYKDNTHAVDYTYKDIFEGRQVNTVFAPNNDAIKEFMKTDLYKKWKESLEKGESRAEDVVNSAGYNFQQQFIGNHIALWRRNISGDGIDTLRMINGKNLEFDKTKKTLAGLHLVDTVLNKPATNGVLHGLQGIAPFHYNFYEYLKYPEDGVSQTKLGAYIVGNDTTYFSDQNSVEGLPDENGNPTYVDSVYYTTNRLFLYKRYLPEEGSEKWQMTQNGFGEFIDNEDSVFIMLLPTDAAWDATYEMLKASHKYASAYDDKSKNDLINNSSQKATAIKGLNPDSLQKMSIEMDMVSPLVFNLHKQPKRGGSELWTLNLFKEYKGDGGDPENPDNFLLNTFGDTLRSIKDVWDKESLFEGEPIEMSNGIAYEVSSWNFPSQFYTPDVEVEIENTGIFYQIDNSSATSLGPGSKKYSFSNENLKDIADLYGRVSNGNFYHLDAPGPSSKPKAVFKLYGNSPTAYVPNAQVMSGTYEVQVVVVPRWYIELASYYEDHSKIKPIFLDPEKVDSAAAVNKYKFKTQVSYNKDGSSTDKKSTAVTSTYDGKKVDTISVATVEFPYSYKNMRYSYPTLIFEGATTTTDAKKGFVYDVVIDKIILRRKD